MASLSRLRRVLRRLSVFGRLLGGKAKRRRSAKPLFKKRLAAGFWVVFAVGMAWVLVAPVPLFIRHGHHSKGGVQVAVAPLPKNYAPLPPVHGAPEELASKPFIPDMAAAPFLPSPEPVEQQRFEQQQPAVGVQAYPALPEEENYGRTGGGTSSLAVPVQPPAPEPKLPGWPSGRHSARIALVIDDMGLNMRESRRAVALPAAVTLSYIPYAPRLREQTREAREEGHELMLHMPMEPMGHDNPGPGALLTGLPEEELRQRLVMALSSFGGFDGVNNHMGSKFTASESGMEIVVNELKQRQLFFLDSRTSSQTVGEKVARREGLPAIARDVFLDDSMTYEAVKRQIEQLEHVARRKGYAVAIGHPHPATLQALEEWIPAAKKRGFEFVAVRDLVQQLDGAAAVSTPDGHGPALVTPASLTKSPGP